MKICRLILRYSQVKVRAYYWPEASQELGGKTMEKKLMSRKATGWTIILCLFLVAVAYTTITWAGPPQGVTATLIGRATYGRFKVKTHPPESGGEANDGPISLDFMAQAKPGMDMVVRTFDYAPASTTG